MGYVIFSDNTGQNIWHKIRKLSKTRQDQRNLISPFVWVLSTGSGNWCLQGRLDTSLCSQLTFTIFLSFPGFLTS